jgi:hypothetical protein
MNLLDIGQISYGLCCSGKGEAKAGALSMFVSGETSCSLLSIERAILGVEGMVAKCWIVREFLLDHKSEVDRLEARSARERLF